MEFLYTAAQQRFRDRVRDFARATLAPPIKQLDAEERFDPDLLRALAEEGLLGVCLPRAYGGLGLDYHCLALASEELERVDSFARVVLSVHLSLAGLALYQWGSEAQKRRWLPELAAGRQVAGFALTEPGAGTDAASIATHARRDGSDYRLSGEKRWIGLADVADVFLVFATLDPEAGHRGVSAFLVERASAGFESYSITGKHGLRAGNVGGLRLDEVRVPQENRLGEEGEGFSIAMAALDCGRFGVAAGSLGVMQACLDACLPRCRERRTFGQEIGRHQLVQQMIARMVAGRDAGRALVWQVGELKNRGRRHTREVSLAKWQCADAARQAAEDAVQIFGAEGFSNGQPVERYLRNCRAAVIYEGTREIHQVIQAEYALGYRRDRPLRRSLSAYPFPEDADE